MEQKFNVGDYVIDHYRRVCKVTRVTPCYFFYEVIDAYTYTSTGKQQFKNTSFKLATPEEVSNNERQIQSQKQRWAAIKKIKDATSELNRQVTYFSCRQLSTQQMLEIADFINQKLGENAN